MRSRLARVGLITLVLLTLTTTATAVVGGPDPGEGEMAITGAGDTGQAPQALQEHVTKYTIDVAFSGATAASQGASAPPPACAGDVRSAKQAAKDQFCTQQTMKLACPADDSVVYRAPNGCVISSLRSQGWERVPFNRSAYNEDGTASTSSSYTASLKARFSFRTAGYSVDVSKQVMESYPPQAAFLINISSPDGAAAQVVTTRTVTDTVSTSGTQFQNARVAVVVDGEQVLTRTFTPGGQEAPGPGTPAQGLAQRVAELERRVRTLEQKLNIAIDFIQERHPAEAQTLQDRLASVTVYQDATNQSSAEQSTGRPDSAPGRGGGRPGFVQGLLNAIFG